MTDTPRTGLEFVDAGTTDIDQPVNNNALALDAVVGMSVVSATTTAEPTLSSPADDGKVYILPAGRTGTNWGAQAVGTIAQWYSGNWYFITPWAGLRARAADSGIIYQYTSSWAVWASVFGQSILDDANADAVFATLGFDPDSKQDNPEAWIAPTLLNSFANIGGGFASAGYRSATNRVDLRGTVASASHSTNPVIFNLPVGYRPATRRVFPAFGSFGAGDLCGRVDILANGDVQLLIPSTTVTDYLSLDAISFDI